MAKNKDEDAGIVETPDESPDLPEPQTGEDEGDSNAGEWGDG